MKARRRLSAVLVALWMCGVTSAQPAAAQQGWASAETLSAPGGMALGPQVAFDASGNGLAVWTQGAQDGPPQVVNRSTYTRTTRSWSPPVAMSPPAGVTVGPQLGVAANGDAIVVWLRYDGSAFFVEATHYSASAGTWSTPVDIGGGGGYLAFDLPALAVAAGGQAAVVWMRAGLPGGILHLSVHAAVYDPTAGAWSGVHDLSLAADDAYLVDVAVDPSGNAVAAWTRVDPLTDNERIQTARYDVGAAMWSARLDLSANDTFVEYADVGMDAAGDAIVVWNQTSTIRAARYDAVADTWGAPLTISGTAAHGEPVVAVAAGGGAVAAWVEALEVRAARYPIAGGTWAAATALSGVTNLPAYPVVRLDQGGNAFVAWRRSTGAQASLEAARFAASTSVWAVGTILSEAGVEAGFPTLAVDAAGAAAVAWSQTSGASSAAVQTARWEATPSGAFNILGVQTGSGTLALTFELPPTSDPAFAPVNYEYSVDDGGSWTARAPASTVQPLTVSGLTPNALYTVRLRAVNVAGAGAPSAAVVVVAGPVPSPATRLTATAIAGNTVTIAWIPPPATNFPPTGYVLEGGVLPGQVLASIPTGSTAPTFTFVAPTGTFHIRVHTMSQTFGAPLKSTASNEIRIVVSRPAAPSAPAHLLGQVNGTALALSWTNTHEGGSPTAMRLHVTGALAGVLPLPAGETFAFPAVPPGTYTMRVAAVNASGVSPLSNAVTLTFPSACTGTPGVPTFVTATKLGNRITVAWSPPESGAAVSNYWLRVSGSFVGTFPTTARSLAGNVGPGTYWISVLAASACRAGPPSTPQVVTVP